jgi:hypothetical protein
MGIRFPYLLSDGPLYERLEMARAARRTPAAFQPRLHGGPITGGFGRRIG